MGEKETVTLFHSFHPFFHKQVVQLITGGNLLHWSQPERTYAVTFRLADSLPAHVVNGFLKEYDFLYADVPESERPLRIQVIRRKMMEYLDMGYRECLLKKPEVRRIVEESLAYVGRNSARMHAYVIMPNHVHLLFETHEGVTIQQLLHSLKQYTAKQVNALLRRKGRLWQSEYFDRMVRSQKHYYRAGATFSTILAIA